MRFAKRVPRCAQDLSHSPSVPPSRTATQAKSRMPSKALGGEGNRRLNGDLAPHHRPPREKSLRIRSKSTAPTVATTMEFTSPSPT